MANLAVIQSIKARQMNERNLYIIRKNAALWQVLLRSSGKVQFSSLSKARCNDWLNAQFPNDEGE